MKEIADRQDADEEAEREKELAQINETSLFMKIWAYNNPKWYIVMGTIGAILAGAVFPVFGIKYSYAVTMMTQPKYLLPITYVD